MTDMQEELLRSLRALHAHLDETLRVDKVDQRPVKEAADTIEAQAYEIEELRAAALGEDK